MTTTLARSTEVVRRTASGYPWIAIALALAAIGVYALFQVERFGPPVLLIAVPLLLGAGLLLAGLYMLQPNEAAILLLFGEDKGTDRTAGLRWANPFFKKQKMSLRARNLASASA